MGTTLSGKRIGKAAAQTSIFEGWAFPLTEERPNWVAHPLNLAEFTTTEGASPFPTCFSLPVPKLLVPHPCLLQEPAEGVGRCPLQWGPSFAREESPLVFPQLGPNKKPILVTNNLYCGYRKFILVACARSSTARGSMKQLANTCIASRS